MEHKNLTFFSSYNNFISAYNTLENIYMQNRDQPLPLENPEFADAFFDCFDYLSSLKKEDIDFLKSDINLHCKITMFDTIKLHLISQNPALHRIQALHRIF